jgi:hypothetical protein
MYSFLVKRSALRGTVAPVSFRLKVAAQSMISGRTFDNLKKTLLGLQHIFLKNTHVLLF